MKKINKLIEICGIKKRTNKKNWERAQDIKWRKRSRESSESDNKDLRILKIIFKTIEKYKIVDGDNKFQNSVFTFVDMHAYITGNISAKKRNNILFNLNILLPPNTLKKKKKVKKNVKDKKERRTKWYDAK